MAFTEPWPAPMDLDLSIPLPEDGVRVRLAVAFSPWGTSPFVLSSNSLNPLLRFYEDGLETRVIRKVRHRYTDIVRADLDTSLLSKKASMMRVEWRDEGFQFLARPSKASNLLIVLQHLAARGVPLGPKARAALDAAGDA